MTSLLTYWPSKVATIPDRRQVQRRPKFVVSRSLTDPIVGRGPPSLAGAAEVAALKDRSPSDIHVIGSGDLGRSLLEAELVDRLNLFLYPLTFGAGKRLFPDGTGVPAAFRPAQPPQGFPKGATWLVYERAGIPVTGIDMDTL